MKRLIPLLLTFVAVWLPINAVTDKEMDQARTIAAHAYLRFANNGSGYLDDIKPTSMAQLQAALKPKEKENIKAFLAIPSPADYKQWDKAKLVEFWGTTAFATKGLDPEGVKGRMRARKRISDLNIAAPAPEEAPAPEAAAPAETPAPETPAAQPAESEAEASQQVAEEALIDAQQEVEEVAERKKSGSSTWVYIVILAVLIGVVIWLVVFASNTMKKQGMAAPVNPANPDSSDDTDISRLRSQFADMLARKDEENDALKEKAEKLQQSVDTLKTRLAAATSELASLSTRLERAEADRDTARMELRKAEAETEKAQKMAQQVAERPTPQPAPKPAAAAPQPSQRPLSRKIYLGRANSKGIFVRADRQLNPANDIFELMTTDGVSGSFAVVDNRTVTEMALATAQDSLGNACVCRNLADAASKSEIVNVTSGTAIFEGGCWRVTRKAQILLR